MRRLPRRRAIVGILLVLRARRCSSRHGRRRPAAAAPATTATSTSIEVSGLLDPVVGRLHRRRDHRRRARRAPTRSSSSSTARAPSCPTRALDELVERIRRRRACPSTCGSARPGARRSGRRRRRSSPRPTSSASRPAAASRSTPAAPRRRRRVRRPASTNVAPGATADLGSTEGLRRDRSATSSSASPGVPTRSIDAGRPDPRRARRRRPTSPSSPSSTSCMHTVASPPVAYLLFVIGLALIVFELFTAGVGVAGVVGAGAFVLGCYGLAVLPTNPVGVALLLFAMFGYGDRRPDRRAPGVDRHRHRVVRARVAAALRRAVAVVDHAAGRHRRHGAGHARRHAGHGPHPVLDAHHRAGVDGRRGGRGAAGVAPRRHRHRAGRAVAGPHQPGHPDRRGRAGAGRRDRRPLLEVEPLDGAARDYRDASAETRADRPDLRIRDTRLAKVHPCIRRKCRL